MVATSQPQRAPPDGADSHRELCSPPRFLTSVANIALAEPECPSASIFDSWFDDPNLGGTGLFVQPYGGIDLHSSYPPPWQPVASMTGPFTYRPQGPASLMGLVQQVQLLSAAEKASVLSLLGEGVGEENRFSVHAPANHGAPAVVQSPRQTHRQNKPNPNMDPSEPAFQTGHDRSTNDGIRISLTNKQIQRGTPGSTPIVDIVRSLPAPAPSRDEELDLGEDNRNIDMPCWIALRRPLPQAEDRVITLRRETHVTLDINFEQISAQLSAISSGIKIPATGSVKNYADTTGKSLLEFRINLYGATTKRRYHNVCASCEKREGKKKGNPSLIDFKTGSDMITPKDGKIRLDFVFCCYPKDHLLGDDEYIVEAVLSKDVDQNLIVAQHQLPFSFNVVAKYPPAAGGKRSRLQVEQSEDVPPRLDQRNVRPRLEGHSQGAPGNERTDEVVLVISPRDSSRGDQHCEDSSSGSLPVVLPPHRPQNAGPNVDSLDIPHQAIVPPRTDEGPTPALIDVNPESGSITGGARIWLKGKDFPALIPLFARFGTAVVPTTFSSATQLSCHLPPVTVPGLVDVTLSKDHQPNAAEYGSSIARFQYFRDQDQLLPILMRIQGQAYPEFAPVLQALFAALSAPQGTQIIQGRSQNPIETGLVHALDSIQTRPNFREIVSTTNGYSQTLAHLAIFYDYPSLLRHLVDWCIDLAIPDVNGLTALHLAYMKGDLLSVQILRRGGAPEAAKDKLGRIPSDLQPEGLGRVPHIGAEAHPPGNDNDEQVELGGRFRALDLGEDKASEFDQSNSEDDMDTGIEMDSFIDEDEGGNGSGSIQIAPGSKEPVIKRSFQMLPSLMDEYLFPLEKLEVNGRLSSSPDVQYFDVPQRSVPVHRPTIDTKELLMASPKPYSLPLPYATATQIPGHKDPLLLRTPALKMSSLSSSISTFDRVIESKLSRGFTYRSRAPRSTSSRIANKIAQLPTNNRDIKKLADVRRVTGVTPEDDRPSSGKKTAAFVLQ